MPDNLEIAASLLAVFTAVAYALFLLAEVAAFLAGAPGTVPGVMWEAVSAVLQGR